MIDVIRAGVLTTVQDLGRHGYRHLGIAMGGALDRLALEVGNRLVGNRPDAAALEITFGPVVLRFPRATRIALTGAEFGATLDGKPVYAWWSLPVRAGSELTLHAAKRGMRGYVAIAGGIDVLPMLGSRSTDLAARFGGLGGRALRDGDRLPLGGAALRTGTGSGTSGGAGSGSGGGAGSPSRGGALGPDAPEFGVKAPEWCAFAFAPEPLRRGRHPAGLAWAEPIRILPGPEYDHFTRDAQAAFWSDEWVVTPNSNRMGYRLAGTELARDRKTARTDLLSHAVLPGTIQVPPNGQPIVLMSDAHTTGGYPKIGAVIGADLWKLAQVRLNGGVRFVAATPDEARRALREERTYLRQIDAAIAMRDEQHGAREPAPIALQDS